MTTVLCTLYNSLYLDKGLVLYDSLCECAKDFKLYILCMDDKCYEVLSNLNQKHHIPVKLSDFEHGDNDLLEAKANRSMGEYCWTCSSSFIRYVLYYYNEPICTYIDADMYFYNDPQVLIDEMVAAGKSVMMVPHRFTIDNQSLANKVGTYCVEFNCFMNNAAGLEVLEHWRNKCLECCSNIGDGIHWGDQKYMDEWLSLFPDKVHVCQHLGAGLAEWNIYSYHNFNIANNTIFYNKKNRSVQVCFYHYASLTYRSRKIVDTNIICKKGVDYDTINNLYKPYLLKMDEKKCFLFNKYGIDVLLKRHPYKNKLKINFRERLATSFIVSLIRSFIPRIVGHSYIVRF